MAYTITRYRHPQRLARGLLAVMLAVAVAAPLRAQSLASAHSHSAKIPASEFSRMVREFSEPGGFFFSDNFTSNEISYLQIVSRFKELGVSGGAYIGVGPEQNFTYVAKIRPQIAFIVDIRRQAVIQHLLYKAIFELAKNRAEFLSLLVSRPLTGSSRSGAKPSLEALLDHLDGAPTSEEIFDKNLATVQRTIENTFEFPLSDEDRDSLEYVYSAFWRAGLDISFRLNVGSSGSLVGAYPRLRDLIRVADPSGKPGSFLAREEDYQFVRKLQQKNRVIPVVGDFGGAKAIAAVGNYLRENGYTLSAFYTSNVEQFLFGNESFDAFVDNVHQLPVSQRSVIIRSTRNNWLPFRGQLVPGYRMVTMITLLEKISVFLDDYAAGLYPDYQSLVTTHYISGPVAKPKVAAAGP